MMPQLPHVCSGLARPADESTFVRDIGTMGHTENNSLRCGAAHNNQHFKHCHRLRVATAWCHLFPFLSHISILTRDIDIAIPSVRPPSVAFRYSMKKAKHIVIVSFWHLRTGLKLNCLNLATHNCFWRHRSAPDSLTNWHVGRVRNLFVLLYYIVL